MPKIEFEPWVYDVVMNLQRIEDMHGEDERCLGDILGLVPSRVCEIARGIAAYQRATGTQTEYPPCVHRPNTAIRQYTPCADCVHEGRAE